MYILVNRGSFFGVCYSKISQRVKLHSSLLDSFNSKTFSAIKTTSIEDFRGSRTAWHRDFKRMALAVEDDFKDDDIGETCLHGVLQTYTGLNIASLALLGFIFVYFTFLETRTPYGASQSTVLTAAYAFTCVFGILLCLNAGVIQLLASMVNVSVKFHKCLIRLKKCQVNLIDDEMLKFDNLDLRANIWEGYRFGFRDPIFHAHLDERQIYQIIPYALLVIFAVVVIIAGFWYRAQRIRIFRWRLGIESTVCVGIIRPGEKVLRRVGSGCLVENAWGEVGCLTNWHVFREIKSIPLQQQSRVEVLKKNVEGRDFIKDFTVYGNGVRVSWSCLLPGTKIVIGTSANGSFGREIPHWSMLAEYPAGEYRYSAASSRYKKRESPAGAFTEDGKGLDLVFLGLVKRVQFHGMQERGPDMMRFDSFEERSASGGWQELRTLTQKPGRRKWRSFILGQAERLVRGYHKLRLLGYPGVGGHRLTVMTSYFTGNRTDKGGSWLLTGAPMPSGCSGAPVVNPEGELVGVATQTYGEVSHIRSITDALESVLGWDEVVDVPPGLHGKHLGDPVKPKRPETPKGRVRKRLFRQDSGKSSFGLPTLFDGARVGSQERTGLGPLDGDKLTAVQRIKRSWASFIENYIVSSTATETGEGHMILPTESNMKKGSKRYKKSKKKD